MGSQVTADKEINEASFVYRLKQGDQAAFEKLTQDIFRALWRFLAGRQRVPEDDAMELAQDVLMRVHDNIQGFDTAGKATLHNWIWKIAKNLAIDFHRSADQARKEEQLENQDEIPWESSSDRRISIRTWKQLTWLRGQFEQLPPDDLQILLWREDNCSYAEIANRLNIKTGTARTRHHRAMKKLQNAGRQVGKELLDPVQEEDFGAYA